ncbi:MAG: DUF2452 domain-containing protein [Verrucomicrobiales bacterium]
MTDNNESAFGEGEIRGNLMPYPVSTLSPAIIPNDLTSFKSRGISNVQKALRQRMLDLKVQYEAAVEEFRWNKLAYESQFSFEPVMGETYHVYERPGGSGFVLSMIAPAEWRGRRWIASLQLGVGGDWRLVKKADGIEVADLVAVE